MNGERQVEGSKTAANDEIDSARPDAAWSKAVSHASRLGTSAEDRRVVRDWGLLMMIFYGAVTAVLWGFAAFALSRDEPNHELAVNRPASHASAAQHTARNVSANPTSVSANSR